LHNPITEHEKQYSPIISDDKSSDPEEQMDQPYSLDEESEEHVEEAEDNFPLQEL